MRLVDGRIAEVSERQHGVISRRRLLELGISRSAIRNRRRRGSLIEVWPNVYAVGDLALPERGRLMAAVLTSGAGAVASRRAAAMLWDLRTWKGWPEVTTPRRQRPKHGLTLHVEVLLPDETTTHEGIPLTTPSRTIFDLAAYESRATVRHMLDRATALGLPLAPPFAKLLDRHRRRPGAAKLRAAIEERAALPGATLSAFEAEFLPFVKSIGLPVPLVNEPLRVGGSTFRADFVWPKRALIVELDGHAYHSSRAALERDKRRDRRLTGAGYRVIRITWRHFHDQSAELARDLKAAHG